MARPWVSSVGRPARSTRSSRLSIHAGEAWWLDRADLETAHTAAADDRYDADAWTDLASRFVEGRPYVQLDAVFDSLGITIAYRDMRSLKRLAGVMRSLGWVRTKQRINGQVCNIFTAPAGSLVTREPAIVGMHIAGDDFRTLPVDSEEIGRMLN